MTVNDPIFSEDLKTIADRIGNKAIGLLEGKTLLITGGSGFLGRYIVATLLLLNKNYLIRPCKIISVDNYITSKKEETKVAEKYLKHIKADVTKPSKIKGHIDYIIHAAGIASPIYYKKYPLETIDVAVIGTRNMLELAKKKMVKSILFFSSSEIYGNPDKEAIPIQETYNGNVSPTGPRACYDESKRLGETLCMIYFNLFKTPIKIVRPFNIYGPGMKIDDYRVIPSFIAAALQGKNIPVHSSGQQTRAFCYITDATVGFFKVMLQGYYGHVYNVGNDKTEITMNALAKTINKILNDKAEIKNIDYPENYPGDEPERRCPDLTKIKKQLRYKAEVDLTTGITRTLEWFKVSHF